MLPYFVLDQINLGPIKLYTWGLFVGLGFSAGYLLFYHLARREGLAPIKIAGLALAIFIGAILGAKALAVALASGGAMFMGGLAGAIICGWLYVLLVKLNLWSIADLLVLPTVLGIGIGRIGCILINDHQGAITNLPWAILWPDGVLRHPVGIYESLVGFGLFGIFWFLQKKIWSPGFSQRQSLPEGGTPKLKTGSIFLLFLISYSIIRFLLDFTRVSSGPLADPRWGILSISQWLALLLLTFVLVLFISGKTAKLTRI